MIRERRKKSADVEVQILRMFPSWSYSRRKGR